MVWASTATVAGFLHAKADQSDSFTVQEFVEQAKAALEDTLRVGVASHSDED